MNNKKYIDWSKDRCSKKMKLLDNELEELSVKKNIEEMSLKKLPECFSIISKAIKLNEDILKRHSNIIRTASEIANSSAVIKAMKANRDLMRVADEIANSSTVLEKLTSKKSKMNRNEKCFCGSNLKIKKCHLKEYEELKVIRDKKIFLRDLESIKKLDI